MCSTSKRGTGGHAKQEAEDLQWRTQLKKGHRNNILVFISQQGGCRLNSFVCCQQFYKVASQSPAFASVSLIWKIEVAYI